MATNTTPAAKAPAKAPAVPVALTRGELHAVDDAVNTAQAIIHTRAAHDAAVLKLIDDDAATDIMPIGDLTDDLATLKTAWTAAHNNWAHAEQGRAHAQLQKDRAAVWMARIAYRTASHDAVANKRYPYNITGAAKVLGMPVGTLRPYAKAGEALGDRAGLLSEPDAADIAVLNESFDAGSREDQRQKRLREKTAKLALEAAAKELEALKAAAAAKGETPAGDAPAADAPAGDAPADAPADQAPAADAAASGAQAPAADAPSGAPAPADAPAQRGPSLEDDAVATARQLVAQIKKLRADKGWSTVASKVVAILAEAFPVLKK